MIKVAAKAKVGMEFAAVKQEFLKSVTDTSAYQAWITGLDDARYCRWAGQTTDGRKYSRYTGEEVFPWDGASDMRPFFIDDLIIDDVDIMRMADRNCHMQTLPGNSTAAQMAVSQTSVLDFISRTQMSIELEREKELLAQWRQHFGSSVMAVEWHMDMDSELKTVTMMDLVGMAQQIPQLGPMLAYFQDNAGRLSQGDMAAGMQLFSQLFPQVKNPQAALQSLFQTGQFQYNNSYIKENRPSVRALRTFQDIFFIQGTYDLQQAPWIVRRDVVPKPSVEERAEYEQWDPKFTKIVLNAAGTSWLGFRLQASVGDYRTGRPDRLYVDEMRELCEVFYGFYKGQDPDGNRRLMVTIFHPTSDTIGRQLPNPFLHGRYPFVLCMREKRSRSVIESRGIADIEMTHQSELKNQRDSRNDRTSLGTLPPLQVPLGRGKQQYRLGPRAQLKVMRPGELAWLPLPPLDQETFEVEQNILRNAYNYWGKNFGGVDPNKVLRKQQRLIDGWLGELREVYVQIYWLLQQYLPPEQWMQISGDPNCVPPNDRQSIQQNLNFSLEYDAKDLNQEFLTAKLNLIQQMLVTTDAAGVIDRAGLTQYAANALDPALARAIIQPSGQVTQQEITDEQGAMSKIVSGVEPPVYQSGQNAQLRLQVIQSTMANQDFMNFVRQNPLAQDRLQRRVQNLQFQIQQQQNAVTGRIGVPPGPTEALGAGGGPAPPPTATGTPPPAPPDQGSPQQGQ